MGTTVARPTALFFLPRLGGGGAEMNAVRLATGLVANGLRPLFVVARGPGPYVEFLPPEAEVVVLDTGRIESSTLRLIRSRGSLASLIRERRPDVICPVLALPSVAVLDAVRAVRDPPPVVLSIQNSLSVSHGAGSGLRRRLELQLMKRNFRRCDGVVALSAGVGRELEALVPELRGRVEVVHNVGLPLPAQLEAALARPRTDDAELLRLVACGRLTPQKDYPTLLRAFARLRSEQRLVLDILGVGPLQGDLEAEADRLGVRDRVRFLGFLRDPLTPMRGADVFVLSSLWEGFGNVIVEAMSVGTPVVATDCPHGPAEIISDGVDGLIVPPGDVAALTGALQRLLDDGALRARLGAAGAARAQDFSAERVGAQFASALRGFLDRGEGS